MATPWGLALQVRPRRSTNFATRRLTERPQESVHLERKATGYLDNNLKRTVQKISFTDFPDSPRINKLLSTIILHQRHLTKNHKLLKVLK